jgi:hypothetical protein
MNPRRFARVALLLLTLGLLGGRIASKHGKLSAFSSSSAEVLTEQPTSESSAQVQNESAPLSRQDWVLVSVSMEIPSSPEPLTRQIAGDGTIRLWGEQQVAVAGLTTNEAADRIHLALLTNYIGIIFHKVTVTKVH